MSASCDFASHFSVIAADGVGGSVGGGATIGGKRAAAIATGGSAVTMLVSLVSLVSLL